MADLDARQQAAAERWLKGRREPTPLSDQTRDPKYAPDLEKERRPERELGGPEDDHFATPH
jgi:hypothetical protein